VKFIARGLDARQELLTLNLDASDELAARQQVEQQGIFVVSLMPLGAAPMPRSQRFSLILFAQELHALLSAGLGVTEALDALLEKHQSPANRRVLEQLQQALREGQRLSMALARQPDVFPPLFIGILQAAEGTSDLPRALSRYLEYETRLTGVRQKIVSASIYPLILVLVGGGVAAFLLGYVVPRFATVYRSSGRPLPWASGLLLDWGHFVSGHAPALIAGALLVLASLFVCIRKHLRDGTWWRLLGVIPGARAKLEVLEISRLYLTLGILLQGGLPIMHALKLAQAVLPPSRRAALEQAGQRIAEGEAMSESFQAAGLSAPVALRLLKAGERSGQLGDMLMRAAEYHEGETTRWIERFTKVFEPALMAAIGLVIGTIVVLLYMPIFDLAGSLQ